MTNTSPLHLPDTHHTNGAIDAVLDDVRNSLRDLRYGSVTIIVQDGIVVQIDRTDKRRLPPRGANRRRS